LVRALSVDSSVTKVAAWNAVRGVPITKRHLQIRTIIFGIIGFKVQGVPMELVKNF